MAGWPGLNPPGSDGAPGHRIWLNTGSLPERWNVLRRFLEGDAGGLFDPIDLAGKLSDPSDPFRVSRDLAETFLPVPLEHAGIPHIPEEFGGVMVLAPPQELLDGPAYLVDLAKILLNGTHWYEWPNFNARKPGNVQGARRLVRDYLQFLLQLPAYQLT